MPRDFHPGGFTVAFALCAMSACSQTAPAPAATGGDVSVAASSPASDTSKDGDDAPITHIDCGKIFSATDVAGMLDGKVDISVYPYRDNACSFETGGSTSIQLYSGSGFTNQFEWKAAAANGQGDFKPLAGVGDQAFYRVSGDLHLEMLSRKGNDYCSVTGSSDHADVTGERLAARFGALCNKIFANH